MYIFCAKYLILKINIKEEKGKYILQVNIFRSIDSREPSITFISHYLLHLIMIHVNATFYSHKKLRIGNKVLL